MSDSSSGSESSDRADVASLAVAIVALLVALVALLGTTAQVFQQYLATAVGYSNCGERVMGPWARYTKLVFHPWELRFEVVFRSPEISVEPYLMEPLTVAAIERERGLLPNPGNKERHDSQGDGREAADYSASWLTLLRTVRDMELQSQTLHNHIYPPHGQSGRHPPPRSGIRVNLWRKAQTLDLMPEGVKKPYATTTLSNIVHLAAMLGVHWKQFDRMNDRYVADGNNILITGGTVPHLGIMFSFGRHEDPDFARMRVIPTAHITELSFGLVPTILRPSTYVMPRHLTDIPRDAGTLRFGSAAEIASTLDVLGCSSESTTYGLDSGEDDLFPGKLNEHRTPEPSVP
jgi:hypothetical protein